MYDIEGDKNFNMVILPVNVLHNREVHPWLITRYSRNLDEI